MRNVIRIALIAGAALAFACNSDDPNDGDNWREFIPEPVGLVCESVSCMSDGDCGGDTPNCAPQTNECVECASDADCVELAQTSTVYASRQNCRGFTCVCSSDEACVASGEGVVCVGETGACAVCGRDGDCPAETPACIDAGTPDAFCGCGSNSDCESDEQCIAGECVCRADSACPASAPTCDVERGECFACTFDDDCPAATPFCAERLCVECSGNGDCGDQEICDDGVCTAVDCTENDDCAAGQFCNTTDNVCEDAACASDADCAGNPNGERCLNADTPSAAACGCEVSGDCNTTGRTTCYYGGSSGAYCGCANDNDCVQAELGNECRPGDINRTSASGCVCDADAQCGDGSMCRTAL